jgi:putative nucleotidyltransferase with HDIG domain
MQVANSEHSNMLELAEIISCDPTLMANVLRVSNSSYNSLSEPVEDLSSAILLLGMAEIKRIALSVGSFDVFGAKNVSSDFLRNIWRHSLTTGLIAQQISKTAGFEFTDDAYIAGLLHDLGKLFFATFFVSTYAPLRAEVSTGKADGLALESQIYGMTHLDAAAELCDHWKLPPKIGLIVTNHHSPPETDAEEGALSLCIAASNILAHQVIQDEPVTSRLPQAQAWLSELAKKSSNPEALSPGEVYAILMSEVERAKRFEEIASSKF